MTEYKKTKSKVVVLQNVDLQELCLGFGNDTNKVYNNPKRRTMSI